MFISYEWQEDYYEVFAVPEVRCGELREEGMDEVEPKPLLVVVVVVVMGVAEVRSSWEDEVEAGELLMRFSSERVWRRLWASFTCTDVVSTLSTSSTST